MIRFEPKPLNKTLMLAVGILTVPLGILAGRRLAGNLAATAPNEVIAAFAAAIAAATGLAFGYYLAYLAASVERQKQYRTVKEEVRKGCRCAWSYGEFEPGDKKYPFRSAGSNCFVCEEAAKRLRLQADPTVHK